MLRESRCTKKRFAIAVHAFLWRQLSGTGQTESDADCARPNVNQSWHGPGRREVRLRAAVSGDLAQPAKAVNPLGRNDRSDFRHFQSATGWTNGCVPDVSWWDSGRISLRAWNAMVPCARVFKSKGAARASWISIRAQVAPAEAGI